MKASMPKVAGEDEDLMEDSDDLPSELDMENSSGNEEDEDLDREGEDGDGMSLAEGSDNDDLISLDGEVPEGLVEWDGSEAEEEAEWDGIDGEDANGSKKRKRGETSRDKRKKLRSLPTFASYDDYAEMIENGPDDDI